MRITKADSSDHKGNISISQELIVVALVLTGVYFIVNEFDLSVLFGKTINVFEKETSLVAPWSIAYINTAINQFKGSSIVGSFLLAWSLMLGLLRIKERLVTAYLLPDECPECGFGLERRQRTSLQRIITSCLGLRSMSLYCRVCDDTKLIFRYKNGSPSEVGTGLSDLMESPSEYQFYSFSGPTDYPDIERLDSLQWPVLQPPDLQQYQRPKARQKQDFPAIK